MISVVNNSGGVISVETLEKELADLGCIKVVGKSTARTCLWCDPHGSHFTAPNPEKMYLVPTRTLEALKTLILKLREAEGVPTNRNKVVNLFTRRDSE